MDPKRLKIAHRGLKELKSGMIANLGIGIPSMIAQLAPSDLGVTFHIENGVLGMKLS